MLCLLVSHCWNGRSLSWLIMVWAMMNVNSPIKLLGDKISLEHRLRIGRANDVAAFGALTAAMVGSRSAFLSFCPIFCDNKGTFLDISAGRLQTAIHQKIQTKRPRMKTTKRDFNKAAATWDEQPQRVKLAGDIADAILREVEITSDMNVLDFGCGTGLLTLRLQPFVRTIIGADSSQGMLDLFNAKIAAAELDNICSMYCDLEKGDKLKGKYHLIVSSMTLHHVKEIEPLLSAFHDAMISGGVLCLADLDAEAGQFHDDNTGVFHFGFDRVALRADLHKAGFVDVRDLTAAAIVKPAGDGASRNFPVFLVTARK